jgi:hypothetical protein
LGGDGLVDLITLALAKKYTNNYVAGSYERQMLGKPPLHPSRYGINCKTMYFKMDAGRFNFSWNNPAGRLWTFPAGTVDYNTAEPISTSTAEQPDVTIPEGGGVVTLTSDGWEGEYQLKCGATTTEYIGDLADIPLLTRFLRFSSCSNITGNIADVPPVRILYLEACPLLTGDIADLPSTITANLYLNNTPLITGNLENLPNITGSLYLTNTKVTGAYTNVSGKNVPSAFAVGGTQISAEDMDATLIAFAQCTKTGGSFIATRMTRTSASDEAVAHLTTPVAEGGLGWTVSGLTKV